MLHNAYHNTEGEHPPLSTWLAKTISSLLEGKKMPGMDVLTHCIIVGEVARALIKRTIPEVQNRFFPPGSELIAAAHDLGKLNPLFQEKIWRNVAGYVHNSLQGLESAKPELEIGHAAVSQAALEDYGNYIPKIVGQHHGYSSERYPAMADYLGGTAWQTLRMELLEKLQHHFDAALPSVKKNHVAVLSGLTCVADWIGSGSAFEGIRHVEDINGLSGKVQDALDKAGFVLPIMNQGLSFKAIFKSEPRPAQSLFIETVSAPGIYVLEAPMGMGKTEAALYAAYTILSSGKASGIYFALPTKLTSDKIFDRMNEFLNAVLDDHAPLRKSLRLHSSAWLYTTEMGEEAEPGASWFNQKKRGLLAPFAVGTIDQALMSVMNVKHGFVRSFGLAGKVVILDEVHSYDSYTGTLLDKLVESLQNMGCTVIILSATLTGKRRRELMGIKENSEPSFSYPLISFMTHQDNTLQELPAESLEKKEVEVHCITNDAAVEEALKRAEEGQQVLWIENTVDEAQQWYRLLSSRAAECEEKIVETGLLHSRFVQHDRTNNENKWVELYGKEGKEKRKEGGRILVGTQVLEQSLDIDADFLLTRLCPTDMLLQRIGRLWRHEETVRPQGAKPEVWILTADYEQVLKDLKKLGKTRYVYAPYILLRTLEVWEKRITIKLPQDIRTLIEDTYIEGDEPEVLIKLKTKMEQEQEELKNRARHRTAKFGQTLSDTNAKTRYLEMKTQDILLLRSVQKNEDGSLSLILSDGEALNLTQGIRYTDKNKWRECAAKLTKHIVSVPQGQVPQAVFPKNLTLLKEYLYVETGEKGESSLCVALLKNSNDLMGIDYTQVSEGFSLSYTHTRGYEAKKTGSPKDKDNW